MKRFEVHEMTDPSLTLPRPWPSTGPFGATAGRPYTRRSMAPSPPSRQPLALLPPHRIGANHDSLAI
jgi:hypothetical protein